MEKQRWALLSVYDKTGIEEAARRLVAMNWSIISSGGTAKKLKEAGIPVTDVAQMVGDAILDHRVVTLSRKVHAGLLADALKPQDLAELVKLGIPFIDLVRCDFYPLREAIADPAATIASVVEKTDIGGPCMVRSGAKGLRIVVCRPGDMEEVLCELEKTGDVSQENRQKLRAIAEFKVARYVGDSAMFHGAGRFKVITGERIINEFKGENGPQTPATLFSTGSNDPLALTNFKVVAGAPPSYNNLCDIERLTQTMTHIATGWKQNHDKIPSIAIGVKHGNPCGAAVKYSADNAAIDMVSGDTRAIFGGVAMTNFNVTGPLAEAMAQTMPDGKAKFDGVIAPAFDEDAIETLSRAKGKCRLMINAALGTDFLSLDTAPRFRYVRGGLLVQPNYTFVLDFNDPDIKVYGKRSPDAEKDLLIAWAVGCTSNSNTITIVKKRMLIGNGVGQQDRVGAAELAIKRAVDAGHKDKLNGAAAYSDSFFPFGDAVQVLIDAGIKNIFSTSGSVKDQEIQELCLKNGITLYQLPDSQARGFFGH
jgi:phosphoribosylaminoimidazolecarboxamide formyltransferase / IMP cyclohydrolase